MSPKVNQQPVWLRPLIAVLVIAVFGIILLIVSVSVPKQMSKVDIATQKYEIAAAESIKANIELYFAKNNEYPFSFDILLERSEEADKGSLIEAKDALKDFNYTVRGDSQAYEFTYLDLLGNKQSIKGEYSNDYH